MPTAHARNARALTAKQVEDLLASLRKSGPKLETLRWPDDESDEPGAPENPVPAAGQRSHAPRRTLATLVESDPKTYDPVRRRIRDRYINIRFEGIARSAADLADAKRVVSAARLQFEEGHADGALEILEVAIEQDPNQESLWLAELEIAFLLRDRERFVESARAFREAHAQSVAWAEVERLGRAIAPEEFAEKGKRAQPHFGPLPALPNWLQAPWDPAANVLAADFHLAMTREE